MTNIQWQQKQEKTLLTPTAPPRELLVAMAAMISIFTRVTASPSSGASTPPLWRFAASSFDQQGLAITSFLPQWYLGYKLNWLPKRISTDLVPSGMSSPGNPLYSSTWALGIYLFIPSLMKMEWSALLKILFQYLWLLIQNYSRELKEESPDLLVKKKEGKIFINIILGDSENILNFSSKLHWRIPLNHQELPVEKEGT